MVCVEELLDKYTIYIYNRLYPCCLKNGFSLKICPCFVLSDPIRINVLSDLLYVWVLFQNGNSQLSFKFGFNFV